LILDKDVWTKLKDDLSSKKVKFIIGPKTRFEGKEEEQGTFFIVDPFGNFIEIKCFKNQSNNGWV